MRMSYKYKYKARPRVSRVCRNCDKCFETTRQQQVYCSRNCARKDYSAQFKDLNPVQPVCTATVGAIAELVVSIDLLRHGYSVFRSLSPACDCDLVILFGKQTCRVEVKTAYLKTTSGEFTYPKCDPLKYDILALVHQGQVTYKPSVEEWLSAQ